MYQVLYFGDMVTEKGNNKQRASKLVKARKNERYSKVSKMGNTISNTVFQLLSTYNLAMLLSIYFQKAGKRDTKQRAFLHV